MTKILFLANQKQFYSDNSLTN